MREQQLSWEQAIVEGSLEWAFLRREDLGEVAELCAAIEYFDDPTQHRELSGLTDDFDRPWAYPTNHAVVGRDRGGTIVAYGWNHITRTIRCRTPGWRSECIRPGGITRSATSSSAG